MSMLENDTFQLLQSARCIHYIFVRHNCTGETYPFDKYDSFGESDEV